MTNEEIEEAITKISLILVQVTQSIKLLEEVVAQTQEDIGHIKETQSGTIESGNTSPRLKE